MSEIGDFRCPRCEAEFPTWRELDDHQRSAHLVVESGRVRCPTCGGAFVSQPALDQHQREAHDVPVADEWDAPVAVADES
jgi:uncharacterized C2H2 Zn-finger protein